MKHFDSLMKKAWLTLLIIGAITIVLPSPKVSYSADLILIGIFVYAIYSAWVVFLLKKLATEDGLLKSSKPMSIWGYIWRAMIVHYISMNLAVLTMLMTIGVQAPPSILSILLASVLQSLFSVVAIWGIFSKNRKSQILWIFSLSRGY
ncbi:hypothetical protein [Pseudomonas cichorii]|uniref:hypothetical protein n=1 Tax=Pseudomonas cichorii TaxID=36746 RepID=UPI000EFED82D|nr:hypothetical protein [Pseudomonas cichorii]